MYPLDEDRISAFDERPYAQLSWKPNGLCTERSSEELEEEWNRILPHLTEALAALGDSNADPSTDFIEDDTSHRFGLSLALMWKSSFCARLFFLNVCVCEQECRLVCTDKAGLISVDVYCIHWDFCCTDRCSRPLEKSKCMLDNMPAHQARKPFIPRSDLIF